MLLCCMKTIKDVFIEFKKALENLYDVNEIEALILLVISEICNLSKAQIKAFPEYELSAIQNEKLVDAIDRLKTGMPVQYVLGRTEFYGLPFIVNPSVLIPRPETEELVDWVIGSVGRVQLAVGGGSILDIGTGSGCIAISLKKNLPTFNVLALDISTPALKTAAANAELNEVDVKFIKADILKVNQPSDPFASQISNLIPIAIGTQISIIISNPPYVTMHDKTQMHNNVIDFEPHNALFVPEDDPLIFYKAIADFAIQYLSADGWLFFEINENYGKQTVDVLNHKGFKNIELTKDLNDRDRMIKASK